MAKKIARPLRRVNGRLVTVDQDSADHVQQQMVTLVRYEPGQYGPDPEYGRPQLEFEQDGPPLDELEEAFYSYIAGAEIVIEEDTTRYDEFISNVVAEVY